MEKMIKRIKNNHGESLTETLVAILVAGLAMALLSGMISTSVKLTSNSSRDIGRYYDQDKEVALKEDAGKLEGAGTLIIQEKNGETTYNIGKNSISVNYYMNTNATKKPVISYKKANGSL